MSRFNPRQTDDGGWVIVDTRNPKWQPVETLRREPDKSGNYWRPVRFVTRKAAERYCNRKQESEARRDKWVNVWLKAHGNMPRRLAIHKTVHWDKLESVTVPEFIKGQAKKCMRLIDGRPHKKRVQERVSYFGKSAALARLMGFYTTNRLSGAKAAHGMAVRTAMERGSVPRDPKKAALLQQLASNDGKVVAIKLLSKMGYDQYKH